jgi:hypothetical protein
MPPVQLARLKTCSIKRSGYRDLVLSGEASAQYTSGLAKVHWVSPAEAGTLMVGMHTPTPVPRWLCHAVSPLARCFAVDV